MTIDRNRKDDAVSPVVGVMLMLVVTIIIAAVVSAFAGGDQHFPGEGSAGEYRHKYRICSRYRYHTSIWPFRHQIRAPGG